VIHAFRALRVRDFRLLWAGGLVSSVGTWLLTVAVPAQVLQATGSLRDTGLTLAAEYLPQLLLGPVAGVTADCRDRRLVMAASSAASAAAVAVMLLGTAPGRYWVLYIALAAESSTAVFYTPAIQARIPEIVGTGPLLSSASSLTAITSGVVRLIGGPLGGVLFAFLGIRWLICADAASYLIAAAAALMTFRHPSRQETAHDEVRARFPVSAAANGVRASLVAGVRALRRSPAARGLLAVQVLFLAANASLSAVLIPFGIRRLGGSTQTGLLMAALGAGFLLGAPVLRILLDRVQARHTMAASLAITAAGYVGLFSSTTIAAALPAGVTIGMTGAVVLSVPVATVQRVTGNEVLGRITAAFTTGGAAATMTGAVAGPLVAQAIQLTGAAVAAASVTLAAAALALVIVPRTVLPTQPPAGRKTADPEQLAEAANRVTRHSPDRQLAEKSPSSAN
jgi:MFS family permease